MPRRASQPSPSYDAMPIAAGVAAARVFRVGALAIGARRANAVGTVRLSCLPDGLGVDLVHVGRFAAGFALIGMGEPMSFQVPYTAVRGMVRSGSVLHLALDPAVATPFQRFALCHFSDEPHPQLLRTFRARALGRLLRVVAPVPLAALAMLRAPSGWLGGPVGMAAFGVLLTLLAWVLLGRIVDWLSSGGPASDRLRDTFEQVLAHYLGLEPVHPLAANAAATLDQSPVHELGWAHALRGIWGVVARPRAFALVGGLGLVAALVSVLAVRRYGVIEHMILPVLEGRAGAADPVRRWFAEVITEVKPRHPPCSCERASSPLWDEGVPTLAIVVSPRRGGLDRVWVKPGDTLPITQPASPAPADGAQPTTPAPAPPDGAQAAHTGHGRRGKRKRHEHARVPSPEVDLDLAVVNDGARPLSDVRVIATFAQRSPDGRRMAIMERGLAWPGQLAPGQSVKWHVEAEGTEVRIDCPIGLRLDPRAAAQPSALRKLLGARLPAVRLHAAMMLAFLGDPGAEQVAAALGPLSEIEERARREILRSFAPLRVCDPKITDSGLGVCIQNGTSELVRSLTVTERADPGAQEPPSAPPRVWRLDELLRPRQGLRVDLPWSGGPAPAVLEATASATPSGSVKPPADPKP